MAILGEKRLFQLPKNGHLLELLKGIPQLQEFAIALQSLLGYGDGWSDDGSGDNKMTHIIDDPLSLLIHYWWYRYTPLIHYCLATDIHGFFPWFPGFFPCQTCSNLATLELRSVFCCCICCTWHRTIVWICLENLTTSPMNQWNLWMNTVGISWG